MSDNDPITPDLIQEGAAAICPADHRHLRRATEPPCGDCYATAEAVIRATQRESAGDDAH